MIDLKVLRCREHGTTVLMLEEDSVGARLLGGKCCINQYSEELARWRVSNRVGELLRQVDEGGGK